jgi:hypothetical protein
MYSGLLVRLTGGPQSILIVASSKVNDVETQTFTRSRHVLVRTALFWVVTQGVAVIPYRNLGTTVVVISYRRFWSDRLSRKIGKELPLLLSRKIGKELPLLPA